MGFFISHYPAVLGSDIAGTVLSTGPSVPPSFPQPGTRIAAFAPCFFKQGLPDYGALQTRVLVPAVNAVELPDGMPFNEGALLPMAVMTAWSGWYTIGLPREMAYQAGPNEGMLVWGGASSVGSAAVQSAKLLGFTVYATASAAHHEYVKKLGASRVWDYHGEGVVAEMVAAAKADGVELSRGFDAVGQNKYSMAVLKEFVPRGGTAKLASAVPFQRIEDAPEVEGVEARFVMGPEDEGERGEFFGFVFRGWLREKLGRGEFVPSPHVKVVEGGLEGVNRGLDELKGGVSGTKLVLEV